MSNFDKKRLFYPFLGSLLILIFLSPAQDLSQVPVETVKLAESISMLTGAGGNIGVSVGTDGILLIDSQFPQLADKNKAALAALSAAPVRLLLNTNWHYDHVMGNEWLAQAGAVVIAHENARTEMTKEQAFPEFGIKFSPYPESALPKIALGDSLTIHFNGELIRATHFAAAHSDADLAFYFLKANVMHTGDLFFPAGFPFIDVSHGGSIDGLIAAGDKLLRMTDANRTCRRRCSSRSFTASCPRSREKTSQSGGPALVCACGDKNCPFPAKNIDALGIRFRPFSDFGVLSKLSDAAAQRRVGPDQVCFGDDQHECRARR